MNRIFIFMSIAVLSLAAFLLGSAKNPVKSEEITYTYTIQDVRNLQDFLLAKPTEDDLTGKPYDLNGDDRWDVFDLCMMKRKVSLQLDADTNTLVAYFSQTGSTEKIAEYITELTGADSYEIEAAVPYTEDDIRYQDSDCRANIEQNDKLARPEIAASQVDIDSYDVIYLGYPIWWGEEPRIIDTFLESYDFSDKVVIPFCTSGSSGISTSEKNITELVPIGHQLAGKRFSSSAALQDVQTWIERLEIPMRQNEQKLKIEVNGTLLTATLADTAAAKEFAEYLSTDPVTVTLNEYGGFEKVGKLPWSLTKSDERIVTEPGDIMLYQGNQMTIFYSSNTWSYTRLGSIDNVSDEELANIFGNEDISVTLSLQ
ncbi:MAG: hypothetical protein J6B75_11100 [Ruminococcus sp.]|nr:hypothetical protein [Ruminococcus sp.]MBO5164963.1 hypothetical protein [Ruminococcus sp.]